MTITRIIRGPYRLFGYWWVDVDYAGIRQHLMRPSENLARAIAVGREAV